LEERRRDYKRLLFFALLGSLAILLLLRLTGVSEGWEIFKRAKREFILLALAAESLRYLGVALLTQIIAGFLGQRIKLLPTLAATFAGSSVNRLLYAGGIGGMYVRYRYLEKNDLSLGSVSVLFFLQYIVSALVLLGTFTLGLLYLLTHRGLTLQEVLASGVIVVAVLGALGYLVRLYQERQKFEKMLLSLYRKTSSFLGRLFSRRFFSEASLRTAIRRLYRSIRVARNHPREVLGAFACGALTLFADILCLYFAFSALGFEIHPGTILVGYTVANYAGAISMLPDGIVVTEGSLALVYSSLAVPQKIAAMAILLFRLISYWLPIPLGFLALWILRRRSLL
jgi:uncharacterized protein (TIRG00374 family)